MVSDEIMLKVENVSKVYKLGEIGGTTLRDELQRLKAKIRHKEDPTKKIGAKNYNKGEKFKALDNISFEVKKGERIGIIGHNGAGKSTLLKLISRVTGPTEGNIYLNGRVASMLEVGTGFHPELTGRENVYMNGAILGMTKKEIDAKMEDIIEFSEVRQFIDTPVKRYSSGMYVKLAFSVAAHLDSEIMIMDEVLAVGDVAFQNKCLTKMKDVSEKEEKTILYVSHNMNTIRQLCDRVIVLNRGTIVFNGAVEEGISAYLEHNGEATFKKIVDLVYFERPNHCTKDIGMSKIEFLDEKAPRFIRGDDISFSLSWFSKTTLDNIKVRMTIRNSNNIPIGTSVSTNCINSLSDYNQKCTIVLSTNQLTKGKYFVSISMIQLDKILNEVLLDHVTRALSFDIIEDKDFPDSIKDWTNYWWGNIHYLPLEIEQDD